jgi:hypothetical protein
VIQGTFGTTQGTFGTIQGTFGTIPGTFGTIQRTFGDSYPGNSWDVVVAAANEGYSRLQRVQPENNI